MNDEQIEGLLRTVRPAGPPPHLRARIVASRPSRVWPWAAAAAALFAIVTALQYSAAGVRQDAYSAIAAAQPGQTPEIDVLREAYGSDEAALQAALLRREFDALGRTDAKQETPPQ
jgi:hypothetical protein